MVTPLIQNGVASPPLNTEMDYERVDGPRIPEGVPTSDNSHLGQESDLGPDQALDQKGARARIGLRA